MASVSPEKPLKVIIMGAPCAGKGTQCRHISQRYGLISLGTGDMLRAAVKAKTPLGLEAKRHMEAGNFVPNPLMFALVKERLTQIDCLQKGWILDGFPRTGFQARFLGTEGLMPDVVVELRVPDEILIGRAVGRRLDPQTGKTYHLKFVPPPPDIVDRLVTRPGDTRPKMMARLDVYTRHAAEVAEHFGSLVKAVNGSPSPDIVTGFIFDLLDRTPVRKPMAPSRELEEQEEGF